MSERLSAVSVYAWSAVTRMLVRRALQQFTSPVEEDTYNLVSV